MAAEFALPSSFLAARIPVFLPKCHRCAGLALSGLVLYQNDTLKILGWHCQILRLEIGRQGWLLVDVGDTEHGPHRIALSVVRQVRGTDGDENVYIETEFTIYQLRKIRAG